MAGASQQLANPDPDAVQAYNHAMQSKHPYDVIVQAYKRSSIVQQIEKAGGDPDKWVMQRAAELQAQQAPQGNGRQQSNGSPQGSIVKLPPSMKNVASSQVSDEDDERHERRGDVQARNALTLRLDRMIHPPR